MHSAAWADEKAKLETRITEEQAARLRGDVVKEMSRDWQNLSQVI